MTGEAMERMIKALRQDWLDQPVLSFAHMGLFLIGAGFWIEAQLTAEAFNVDLYGEFALRFPAEMWAGAMMGGAALTWIGLVNPVRRWMVFVGASIHAAMFLGLAYSAMATNGEMVIGLFCSFFFAPLSTRIAWEAATHEFQ